MDPQEGPPVRSEASTEDPKVLMLDESVDPSTLRWVGTEFIFFLDVLWLDDLEERLVDPSHRGSSFASRTDLSMHGLTFGLLETVLRIRIPPESLFRPLHCHGDSCKCRAIPGDDLARAIVPRARELCSLRASSQDNAEHRAHGERVKRILADVASALDDAIYSVSGSLMGRHGDALFVCMLTAFLVSLSRCAHAIWGGGPKDRAFKALEERTRLYGEVTQILRNMLERRWGYRSAFEMERLLAGGIPFAAYAISCAPTSVNTDRVDTVNYIPRHTAPGCACAFLAAPMDDVRRLLERGEVPVVVLEGSQLVVRSASSSSYVAVSHVWADGIGSTTEEGLPRCQVERLAKLAGTLIPGGAFWQDGLCVPQDKPLRRRAIGLMAETYAKAEKVLVIDAGIQSQCSRASSREECLLRIATSGWMQRIWTLQEGILARELFFEVADGLIDCTHFDGAPYHAAGGMIPLLQYCRRDDSTLTYRSRSLASRQVQCTVNDLIVLLRYRTTSHPEDEALAVAGLLGVDAGVLVKVEGQQERMKALLTRVGRLPRQLAVFGWFCDRLSIPNFTWAPMSLSDVLWPGDPDDPLVATCTDDGLFGEFTVIRFPEVDLGRSCGVIATITEERAAEGTGERGEEGEGGRQFRCTRAGCASKVFNLVLSPHAYRNLPPGGALRCNGFLMKQQMLPESMREEGVGVVHIKSETIVDEGALHCGFVAPGSARFGVPIAMETTRTRGHWHFVSATVEVLRRVRLT
ncbi:hypothetical protein C8T65DRAFT_834361 [Cerioporus squamosus]|nr:hypothetical protein C8T65DRAFT_834361 [Cerioporus squamosus]